MPCKHCHVLTTLFWGPSPLHSPWPIHSRESICCYDRSFYDTIKWIHMEILWSKDILSLPKCTMKGSTIILITWQYKMCNIIFSTKSFYFVSLCGSYARKLKLGCPNTWNSLISKGVAQHSIRLRIALLENSKYFQNISKFKNVKWQVFQWKRIHGIMSCWAQEMPCYNHTLNTFFSPSNT